MWIFYFSLSSVSYLPFHVSLWFTFLHYLNIFPFLSHVHSSFICSIFFHLYFPFFQQFLPPPQPLIFLHPPRIICLYWVWYSILTNFFIIQTCLITSKLVLNFINSKTQNFFTIFFFAMTSFLPTATQTVY